VKQIIAIDIEKCVGCHSCQIACALAHSDAKTLFEAAQQEPPVQSRISVLLAGNTPVAVQCRHCDDPPCVEKCPKDAMQKRDSDGVVTVDAELCTACKVCIKVCPLGEFGVISISLDEEAKTIIKCDMCVERISQGLLPACVAACPTGALALMDPEAAAAQGRLVTVEELAAALDELQQIPQPALSVSGSSDEKQ